MIKPGAMFADGREIQEHDMGGFAAIPVPNVEVFSMSARVIPAPRRLATIATVLALLLVSCSGGEQESSANPTTPTTSGVSSTIAVATTTSTTTPPTEVVVIPEYPDGFETAYFEDLGTVALGRINILVDDPEDAAVADEVAKAVGGTVIGAMGMIGLYQIELPDNSSETLHAAIETAAAVPGVTGAAADVEAHQLGTACESTSPLNAPSYQQGDNAGHYEAIGLQEAWDIIAASGIKKGKVHVGVVDGAFMPTSTEDEGAVKILTPRGTTDEWSVNDKGEPDLGHLNHGTSVTHIIAADPDNGGVAGVASALGSQLTVTVDNIYDNQPSRWVDDPDPDNPAHIVDDATGGVYTIPTLEKILRQVEEGATIINMSYGPDRPSRNWSLYAGVYRRFFEKMGQKYPKVVFVAAAGNESGALTGDNYFPGGLKLPNLVTVAAVDQTGDAAKFTNTTSGDGEVTIAAPGVNVPLGIDPTTDQVFTGSGTSFATPMVTGAIALIQSVNPDLTAAEIQRLLQDTARDGVAARDDADTSKLIPDSVGGKIMRVDDAVLAAINKARAAADPPQPALDKDELLAAARFAVEASQRSYGVFEITAGVEGDEPGTMAFELFGEGSVSGNSSQTASQASPAVWEATLADPGSVVSAKVCRTEAGSCCVLTLESVSVAGTYSGALVIGTVEADGDLVVTGTDGDEVITKEECEQVYSELLGGTFSVVVTLADDGSGVSGGVTSVMSGPEGDEIATTPTSWSMSGNTVSIPLTFAADGYSGSFVLEGAVSFGEDGTPESITGTWVMVGVENLTFGGDFTLTRG